MSENAKMYIMMFVMCLFITIYVKYLHEPLINATIRGLGLN